MSNKITQDMIDKLNYIYKHFGGEKQFDKLGEECHEYYDCWNNYDTGLLDVCSEIADVFVLSAQFVLNNPIIKEQVEFKLNRTLQRIADGYYKDMRTMQDKSGGGETS